MRSLIEAEHARDIGLDLIITDHHHPGKELPPAFALINPKQLGDLYPDRDLAGVGLAFKLVSALSTYLKEKGNPVYRDLDVEDFLDLVAVGTVADLAPLVGENRAMVRAGLKTIHHPRRQGLLSLIGAAGLKAERVTASDIGFVIGPRLNAAGRLDSALAAFNLLTTQDVDRAGQLAQQLDNQNLERQRITKEIQIQAEELALAENPEALLLFAAHEDFNPGVVGLAASRLCELYYRPTIIAHRGQTYTRGSCRSIREFHITEALDECDDLLVHHGGHAAAAGFTVRSERLPELIQKLQGIAIEQLAALELRPTLYADVEIPLSELKPDLIPYLEWMQPTGYGNRQAQFVTRNLHITSARSVGRDSAHLRLSVTDGKITYDAIAFRLGHWLQKMPPAVDLLYTFETNEFNGRVSLQLNVKDIQPSASLQP